MIFMKKNILLLLALSLTAVSKSQTVKVVNNSRSVVYFQIYGSDKNSCNHKYSSASAAVGPSSVINYASPAEVTWLETSKPQGAVEYSYFTGTYTDATGGCVSVANNDIGDQKCNKKSSTVINMAKCGGSGNLNLSWSSENGNVTVTIN
jgi:hypothetical protein